MAHRVAASICIWTAATAGFAAAVAPQRSDPLPLVDVQHLGPQVGDRVPDFTLRDQRGATRTIQSLMGPKGAVLVFFRSADW